MLPPPVLPHAVAPAGLLDAAHAFGQAAIPPRRFGWPVRPFHRQHVIRASFGEPRGIRELGLALRGAARADVLSDANQVQPAGTRWLHTGVDIVAPDGTPVYAVESGVAHTGGRGYDRYTIVGDLGYWHLAHPVPTGTHVVAFHTVIGRVYPGQHHVHLTRFAGGRVPVNPLVAGGLTPYRDTAAPVLGRLTVFRPDGVTERPTAITGPVALVVQAYDVQSFGQTHTGVYRLRYALLPWVGRRAVVGPYTVVRFNALPAFPVADFLFTVDSTRHALLTRFYYRLTARSPSNDAFLHTGALTPGRYRLVVTAWDERGNHSQRTFGLRIVRSTKGPR